MPYIEIACIAIDRGRTGVTTDDALAFEPESLSRKHTPRHDANGESMSTVIPLYTLHAGLLPGHRHSSQRVAIGPVNAAD